MEFQDALRRMDTDNAVVGPACVTECLRCAEQRYLKYLLRVLSYPQRTDHISIEVRKE